MPVQASNKGIGFKVARQLGLAGFTVLLGARDASRGEGAADKLRREGFDARFVVADLNRASECGAALAKQIGEEFGRLDVLVNNAGTGDREDGPASVATVDALRRTFETNFFGTVALTPAAAAIAARGGWSTYCQRFQRTRLGRNQRGCQLTFLPCEGPRL